MTEREELINSLKKDFYIISRTCPKLTPKGEKILEDNFGEEDDSDQLAAWIEEPTWNQTVEQIEKAILKPLVEVYDKWNTYLESDDMSHEGDNEMIVDMWNVIKTVVKNHKGER